MPDLTYGELTTIRSWVGDTTPSNMLQEKFNRLGSIDKTILEVLREQLATTLEEPSSISIPGLSVSFGNKAADIRATISEFEKSGGTDGVFDTASVASLKRRVRDDYR